MYVYVWDSSYGCIWGGEALGVVDRSVLSAHMSHNSGAVVSKGYVDKVQRKIIHSHKHTVQHGREKSHGMAIPSFLS